MATGTLNSSNSLRAQPGQQQQAPASPVIRSGESISSTAAALNNLKAKTYHHLVPGARFVMPDGLAINFMGGRFTTDDAAIIAELDKVADKPTSQIYTHVEVAAAATAQQTAAAQDATTSTPTGE